MSDIKTVLKIAFPLVVALVVVVVVNVIIYLSGHEEGAPRWLDVLIFLTGLLFTMLNFIGESFRRIAGEGV